ncbi:MAG: hypothetical protein AAGC68_05575 [Verrucomicrobiota bacterium]
MPLRFECPHCAARLSAVKEQFHTVVQCPECDGEFMVPAPQDIKLPTDEIKFVCPTCRRKLSATPEQFGTQMPCPYTDCDTTLAVPGLETKWTSIPL